MNSEKKPLETKKNPNSSISQGAKKNKRKPYYMKSKEIKDARNGDSQSENIVSDVSADERHDSMHNTADVPNVTVNVESGENTNYVHVTGVRFKPNGKIYYFDKGEIRVNDGAFVIVDTARGLEFGEAAIGDLEVKEASLVLPLRKIIRLATAEDAEHNRENKAKEAEAFTICNEKIAKHGLDMKLIETQYSFDNSKLLFYFTSATRVDFRELVKDLAGVFKTRIELRQIGIRDEAKLLGGLGTCGRPLCCTTFLSDFVQVSIRMAKEQNLSLNSGKISGCCGRLMCCLQYEYSTYAEEAAKTPPVDSTVKTPNGIGVVTETDPLSATLKVKLVDKPDAPPEMYKRDSVTLISRPSPKRDGRTD